MSAMKDTVDFRRGMWRVEKCCCSFVVTGVWSELIWTPSQCCRCEDHPNKVHTTYTTVQLLLVQSEPSALIVSEWESKLWWMKNHITDAWRGVFGEICNTSLSLWRIMAGPFTPLRPPPREHTVQRFVPDAASQRTTAKSWSLICEDSLISCFSVFSRCSTPQQTVGSSYLLTLTAFYSLQQTLKDSSQISEALKQSGRCRKSRFIHESPGLGKVQFPHMWH